MAPERAAATDHSRHIPALDGLRGVAIALVLLHHAALYGGLDPDTPAQRIVWESMQAGWSGVDLFFVLSGFLITGILLDTKGKPGYLASFYGRRVLRIFPVYYGTLLIAFLLVPALTATAPAYEELTRSQGWFWSYLVNFRISIEGWSAYPVLDHFWTLAVEEQFYLVWPLVVMACRPRTLLAVCVGCIIASAALRIGLHISGHGTAAYLLTPARMDSLAIGAALAAVLRSSRGCAMLQRTTPWVAAGCVLALLGIFAWQRELRAVSLVMQSVGYPLLAILSATVIARAVLAPSEVLSRALEWRVLRGLGRYSYALYVAHHPIILLAREAGVSVHTLPVVSAAPIVAQLTMAVLLTLAALAIAVPSWYLIERPAIGLKRFLPYPRSEADGSTGSLVPARSATGPSASAVPAARLLTGRGAPK